jgi:hypothetical protein
MVLLAFVGCVLAWNHRNHAAAVGYSYMVFIIQHKCAIVGVSGCLSCSVYWPDTIATLLHLHLWLAGPAV